MIYADYAATTPVDRRVVSSMQPYLEMSFYNPSSLYPAARQVRQAVEQARRQVGDLIDAADGRVIFTSGGTESDNLALIGTALHPDNHKRHLITSAVEHHAVLESCAWLERMGFRVTYLPVDAYGRVDPEELRRAIDADTFLVSVMWVNNEVGAIADIETLAGIAHEAGVWFHTDAVQAMTTQNVTTKSVDLLTLSSHKIYGPKGAGALYVRDGVPIAPILHGGQQEGYLRGGTENVPAIVGMGKAAQLLQGERETLADDLARWKRRLIDRFSGMDGLRINSPIGISADSVLHLAFEDIEAEGLLFWLSKVGVAASMGSACDTARVEPSHVVRAIGLPESYARGCLRLSFGRGLDDHLVDALADRVQTAVARMRR